MNMGDGLPGSLSSSGSRESSPASGKASDSFGLQPLSTSPSSLAADEHAKVGKRQQAQQPDQVPIQISCSNLGPSVDGGLGAGAGGRPRQLLGQGLLKFCFRHRYRLFGLAVLLATLVVVAACHEKVAIVWGEYSSWLEQNAAIPTIAAGAIYSACSGIGPGVALGTAIIFVGATLGSIVAFLLGRYIFRDWLQSLNRRSRWAKALDIALKENGLKVIVLMRLSPAVPYSVFNYFASLTSVPFKDFLLGSAAILPGTVLFVFLGAQSAAAIVMVGDEPGEQPGSPANSNTIRIVALSVGIVISILAVLLMGFYTKKALRRYLPGMDQFDDTDSMTEASSTAAAAGMQAAEGNREQHMRQAAERGQAAAVTTAPQAVAEQRQQQRGQDGWRQGEAGGPAEPAGQPGVVAWADYDSSGLFV
eukprot:CAMPEP_0117653326 /NCGR_PEP_ID=MMETSP0804-20121206/3126_1 /TAXON_ID=1074897 /ORGANISM="Tetraselmis astigmatica, Strain CCMP880" /LENGTH=418 /DNA_ID=CAMNT_0005459483 /DNA_START=27 /DNA_END=1283 /DNA_ORIENTATION=-